MVDSSFQKPVWASSQAPPNLTKDPILSLWPCSCFQLKVQFYNRRSSIQPLIKFKPTRKIGKDLIGCYLILMDKIRWYTNIPENFSFADIMKWQLEKVNMLNIPYTSLTTTPWETPWVEKRSILCIIKGVSSVVVSWQATSSFKVESSSFLGWENHRGNLPRLLF